MKKKPPITFKNIEEINLWMVNNFDDYLETKEFLQQEFFPIIYIKERAIASVKYKVERLFCFYFESLQKLLILKNKDANLRQLIDNFHTCKNDKELLENWYSNINYYIHEIDSNYSGMCFIEYQNNNPIGIKPFESESYKENPYVLPIDGFENFVELAKIINFNSKSNYLYGQSHL